MREGAPRVHRFRGGRLKAAQDILPSAHPPDDARTFEEDPVLCGKVQPGSDSGWECASPERSVAGRPIVAGAAAEWLHPAPRMLSSHRCFLQSPAVSGPAGGVPAPPAPVRRSSRDPSSLYFFSFLQRDTRSMPKTWAARVLLPATSFKTHLI